MLKWIQTGLIAVTLFGTTGRSQTATVSIDIPFGEVILSQAPVKIPSSTEALIVEGDVDNDQDIDLIGLAVWWKNVDGSGTNWTEHGFEGKDMSFPDVATAADFDQDDDFDFVVGSDFFDDGLLYRQNLNGDGSSLSETFLSLGIGGNGRVTNADLDNDGDLDIIGSFKGTSAPGGVMWWENPHIGSDSNWAARVISTSFEDITQHATHDLDDSGELEIIVFSTDSDEFAIFKKHPILSNQWEIIHSQAAPRDVSLRTVDDFNDDGLPDILLSSEYDDEILILFQSGSGLTNWQQSVVTDVLTNPQGAHGTDLDGDDDPDILTLVRSGELRWLENLDGTGTNWQEHIISSGFSGSGRTYAADLNGDSLPDAIAASSDGLNVFFSPFSSPITITNTTSPVPIPVSSNLTPRISSSMMDTPTNRWIITGWQLAGDSTNSGTGTIASNVSITNHLSIAFNYKEQYFFETSSSGPGSVEGPTGWIDGGTSVTFTASADPGSNFTGWSGDIGTVDATNPVITVDVDQRRSIRAEFTLQNFTLTVSNELGTTLIAGKSGISTHGGIIATEECKNIESGKFYRNSAGDVVALLKDNAELKVYQHRTGVNSFWPGHILTNNVSSLAVGDVNGDGFDEIIAYQNNTIQLWKLGNKDSLDGWYPISIDTMEVHEPQSRQLAASDMDNDQDLDIVATGVTSNNLREIVWFENLDGFGQIWERHLVTNHLYFSFQTESVRLAAGDLDGDGDADLVDLFFSSDDVEISFLENLDGSGTSWSSTTITDSNLETYPTYYYHDAATQCEFELKDMNQDGFMDLLLLITSGSTRDAKLWINPGVVSSTGWSPIDLIPGGANPHYPYDGFAPQCARVYDYDGDGKLDIIMSVVAYDRYAFRNSPTYAVQVFPNPGSSGNWIGEELDDPILVSDLFKFVQVNDDGALDFLHYGGPPEWRAGAMTPITLLPPPGGGLAGLPPQSIIASSFPSELVIGGTQMFTKSWSRINSTTNTGNGAFSPQFALIEDTELRWHWATRFQMTVSTFGSGQPSPSTQWIDQGREVTVSAVPDPYHSFSHWGGNTNGAVISSNQITFLMDAAREVEAHFTTNVTSQGVPEFWIAETTGITNDFEAAALADTDGDDLPTWQEFYSDTDPNDSESSLSFISIAEEGIGVTFYYQSGESAIQVIESASPNSPEVWVPVHTNIPPTSTLNSFTVPPTSSDRSLYRIRILHP